IYFYMQYNHLCIYNKHLPRSAAIIFITEIYTTFHLSINKKGFRKFSEAFYIFKGNPYIMPGIPPPIGGTPAAAAPPSSGSSANTHSVVNSIDATEAAFSSATRETFVGSITPAPIKFSYTSVRA